MNKKLKIKKSNSQNRTLICFNSRYSFHKLDIHTALLILSLSTSMHNATSPSLLRRISSSVQYISSYSPVFFFQDHFSCNNQTHENKPKLFWYMFNTILCFTYFQCMGETSSNVMRRLLFPLLHYFLLFCFILSFHRFIFSSFLALYTTFIVIIIATQLYYILQTSSTENKQRTSI